MVWNSDQAPEGWRQGRGFALSEGVSAISARTASTSDGNVIRPPRFTVRVAARFSSPASSSFVQVERTCFFQRVGTVDQATSTCLTGHGNPYEAANGVCPPSHVDVEGDCYFDCIPTVMGFPTRDPPA